MVWSVTKGMASTVIHRLADRGLIDYDTPVAEYWPEFGANGKADITVRDVMRHRAGLSQLNGVSKADLLDHVAMEERIAAAPVNRMLYGKPAYHALTYGWLMSGLGPRRHRQGHARPDPRGAGRTTEHRRAAPRPSAGRFADACRADPGAAGHVRQSGVQLRRTAGRRSAVLRGVRLDVLPGDESRRAGRYPVPRLRDSGGERGDHGARPGQDVRGDRQRRPHRRHAVPLARSGWPG